MTLPEYQPLIDAEKIIFSDMLEAMIRAEVEGDRVVREGLKDLNPGYGQAATRLALGEPLFADDFDVVAEVSDGPVFTESQQLGAA